MDKEFITVASEFFHYFESYRYIGEFLPAVCDNEILVIFFAAAEIKYEMFFSCCLLHLCKIFPGKFSIFKHIGSNNDMACAGIQIILCIFRADTATDLKPSRVYSKCFECLVSGGFIIFRVFSIQKNDMSAFQSGVFV